MCDRRVWFHHLVPGLADGFYRAWCWQCKCAGPRAPTKERADERFECPEMEAETESGNE